VSDLYAITNRKLYFCTRFNTQKKSEEYPIFY